MVRLYRKRFFSHADWEDTVLKKLGTKAKEFRRKAKQFERLMLGDPRRCSDSGFSAFAPGALPAGKNGRPEFPPIWRTVKSVKKHLARMSRNKCAYCQSMVLANQAGHVEHFCPKNLFPSLAYVIDNYFLACERCNLAKSDKWPLTGSYVRPDQGDPASRFEFHEDGNLTPLPGDNDAAVTVRDLRLDRKELCGARKFGIKRQLVHLRNYFDAPSLSLDEKRKYARQALVPRLSEYSAAINQNVRRLWQSRFPGVPM